MGLLKEFQAFAVKGNVVDLAVGVIIGGAFSNIVNSVVKDLIMPVVGLATGGLDFSNLFIRLGRVPDTFKGNPDSYRDLQTAGVAVFGYGSFITVLINFLILAFIIFLMVKSINKLRILHADAAAAAKGPSEDVLLLREIRDSLQGRAPLAGIADGPVAR
jgi:large conductance mechanosensitive channel